MVLQLGILVLSLAAVPAASEEVNPGDDKGVIGEYTEDGFPVIMKLVNELPGSDVRRKFSWLTVISWKYDGAGQNGMPASAELKRMTRLEDTIERDLVEQGLCVHAYSRTGNSLKELVYYIVDRDSFMAGFNSALSDHPRYPIEVNFYEDEAWEDFQAILERFRATTD